jgi:glutathione S-transferase
MKLYDCATAPSPRRVRIYLAEKGLDIPVIQVDLASRAQHDDEFLRINPHRTVPVLETDDGARLVSTSGICQYLEQLHPEPPLIGRTALERGQVIDLDSRIEFEGMHAIAEAFRNKARSYANNALTGPHPYAQIPQLVDRGRERVGHFFEWLNEHLAGREFVAGDHYSIADISALVAVDFSAWIKMSPPEHATEIARWHQQVSARPSAKA